MEPLDWGRALLPVVAIVAGLGLAVWAVYLDYARRWLEDPDVFPASPERTGAPPTEGETARPPGLRNPLFLGVVLTGAGVLIHGFLREGRPWLAALGYLPLLAGIGLLLFHLARRLEPGARRENRDREWRGGPGGGATSSRSRRS